MLQRVMDFHLTKAVLSILLHLLLFNGHFTDSNTCSYVNMSEPGTNNSRFDVLTPTNHCITVATSNPSALYSYTWQCINSTSMKQVFWSKDSCSGSPSSQTVVMNGQSYGYGNYYTHCPNNDHDCGIVFRTYIVDNCTESLDNVSLYHDSGEVNDICCAMGSQSYTFTCNQTSVTKNVFTKTSDCAGEPESFPFVGCEPTKFVSYQTTFCSTN